MVLNRSTTSEVLHILRNHAEFMENGLKAELVNEWGHSKYDYKSQDMDNSRNGYSSKITFTSFGDIEVSIPQERKDEFELKVLKKQTNISQDVEAHILCRCCTR